MERSKLVASYGRARESYQGGRFDETLDECDSILASDQTFTDARYLRGIVQKQLGHLEAALADLNDVLESEPNYCEAYYGRATIHSLLENWKAAADDYSNYLRHRTDRSLDYDTFLLRGLALHRTERFEDAVADLTKAIELKPDDGSTYIRRFMVYQDMGRPELAAADFERGQELMKSVKDE